MAKSEYTPFADRVQPLPRGSVDESPAIFCNTLPIPPSHPPASHAAILLSFEAVFAAIFGALLLDERMSGQEIVGAALMFCGVVVSQLRRAPGAERRAGTDASL